MAQDSRESAIHNINDILNRLQQRPIHTNLKAVIESCSGWSLNKLPILRSFIKDGEAECYHDVSVHFIPNMKPVLVLYYEYSTSDDVGNDYNDDGESNGGDANNQKNEMDRVEMERIPLQEYSSKDALHQLFLSLGLTPKSPLEQEQVLETAQWNQYNERLQHHLRLEYYKWRTIYVTEFRQHVMGISEAEYQERTKYQRLTCHPSGPIPDLLNDQYDRINQNVAGAYREDRYRYAVRYLERIAAAP